MPSFDVLDNVQLTPCRSRRRQRRRCENRNLGSALINRSFHFRLTFRRFANPELGEGLPKAKAAQAAAAQNVLLEDVGKTNRRSLHSFGSRNQVLASIDQAGFLTKRDL